MDPTLKVAYEDIARVAGQSVLLFLGEAELENGIIKKPDEAKTWVDYCQLNDVEVKKIWEKFQQVVLAD